MTSSSSLGWLIVPTLVTLLALAACNRSPASSSTSDKPAQSAKLVKPAKYVTADKDNLKPVDAAAQASAAVAAELAAYDERRKPKRAVIGGCNESCETPNKAVGLLFDALAAQDRADKLRTLFEWSLLRVDGADKGSGWAELWGNPRDRPRRDAEIDEWLAHWSSWVERIVEPQGLVSTRMSGVEVKRIVGRKDLVEVRIRHPKLSEDNTESTWRLQLTRRGYEWLISEVDHNPSTRKLKAPSASADFLTL